MTAWTGIIIGGALGGVLGFALARRDLGVTIAASAAGALIGGALTAAKPKDETQASINTPTTP